MAIVQKSKLLISYDLFKQWNGHILPKINDEDKENGILTPDQKYEKWSFHAQTILNAIVQEKLDPIDYDLNLIKPAYQKSFINIMVMRLNRAFYNDEIIRRDSQVQFSQQGGVNYSSAISSDSKSELYSFWDADERALIESSGILSLAFVKPNEDVQNTEGNKFESGEFVPQVNLNEYLKKIILFDGNNITVEAALELLRAGKANVADIAAAISTGTGLLTNAVSEIIYVATGKYIQYDAFRPNKAANELAQVKDVNDSETRSRIDIVANQKKIAAIETKDMEQEQKLDFIAEILEELETQNQFIPNPATPLVGTVSEATLDLKLYQVPDPLNPSQNIQKYTDFTDSGQWQFEFTDPIPVHYGLTNKFDRVQSGTLAISGSQFTVKVSNTGILTITRTSGNAAANGLKLSEIIFGGNGIFANDIQQIINLLTQKVAKKLVQNAPDGFSSFAELKTKVALGDFVNLVFASGQQVFGNVVDAAVSNANDPISIYGNLFTSTQDIKAGLIAIDSNYAITAINEFALKTYVDAKFAEIPENIDATVAANVAGAPGQESLYIQSNTEIKDSNLNSEIKMDIVQGSGNLADVAANKIILVQEPGGVFIPLIDTLGATTGVLFSATLAGTTKTISDIITGSDILVLKKVAATFKPGGTEPYNYLIVKIEIDKTPKWRKMTAADLLPNGRFDATKQYRFNAVGIHRYPATVASGLMEFYYSNNSVSVLSNHRIQFLYNNFNDNLGDGTDDIVDILWSPALTTSAANQSNFTVRRNSQNITLSANQYIEILD